MPKALEDSLSPLEIQVAIHLIRGQRVLLDADLAALYGVTTGALNQAVKRNLTRFPADFMFQLEAHEASDLLSQTVIAKGGRRTLPYAFTEQGVAMLSSVLRSERAVQVNIEIMRAFVRLRATLTATQELENRLDEFEKQTEGQFQIVFEALRQLMLPPTENERRIGLRQPEKPGS